MSSTPATEPTGLTPEGTLQPFVWRGITLKPDEHYHTHFGGGGTWMSADRFWRVSTIGGGYFVAALQLDGENQSCIASGNSTHDALDHLALVAAQLAEKLAGALGQIQ
jgi:hypothetical protein